MFTGRNLRHHFSQQLIYLYSSFAPQVLSKYTDEFCIFQGMCKIPRSAEKRICSEAHGSAT